MTELTDITRAIVRRMFPSDKRSDVEDFLRLECADNLPQWHDPSPEGLERIRLAVLKLSAGDIDALLRAIEIAQTDWRDSLMGAGFGHSIKEHERWADEYLNGSG